MIRPLERKAVTGLFLLVALPGTPQSAPTIKVAFNGDTVIVTTRPPEGCTIKGIAVRRAPEKKLRERSECLKVLLRAFQADTQGTNETANVTELNLGVLARAVFTQGQAIDLALEADPLPMQLLFKGPTCRTPVEHLDNGVHPNQPE